MKRIHQYTMLALVGTMVTVASSCQKANLLQYDRAANIHFALTGNAQDSIMYTFAYDIARSSDTILIPVEIAGYRTGMPRYFSAYVEQDSSTAVAGTHYEALEANYPLPADSGTAYLPVIIYNAAELEERSVSLILKLRATDDFGIEDPTLIRAKLVFSARLEQPQWWTMWLGGYYSRTKHQLFLIATEQTSMTMDGLDAPRNLYYVNLLNMMLNNPLAWVENNPAKGYVLTPRPGEDAYDFYHRDNPARQILLRKNTASGRYLFIDENGAEVN